MEDLVFEFQAGTMTEDAAMEPRHIAFWYRRAAAHNKRARSRQQAG